MIKLDILAIAAHPDDVELGAAGTISAHIAKGYKVGICDLTTGQLGSRGTPEIRLKEAAASSEILGLVVRENLHMQDFFFYNDREHQEPIVRMIRKYQPEILITNAETDRHPDHGKGARLVADAAFLSGLRAFKTELDGNPQKEWRPKAIYHMIQDRYAHPDLVVDISQHFEKKMASIKAFSSQFFDPNNTEPNTPISTPDFIYFLEARAREFGRIINSEFGEGFTVSRPPGVADLVKLG